MNVLTLCTLCDEGRDSIVHIIHTNLYFLQTSCTVGSEVITLKRAQHKIGDSFSKYIEWCFYVGVPMQPTLVFIVLLAKKGQNRPGYNARPYAQSRTDVSTCNCLTYTFRKY